MNTPAHRRIVSVVLPTYNRIGRVGAAIESVLGQTHGEIELIVVDDGSTDGTGSFLQSVYGHDSRVRILTLSENSGRCAARNAALDICMGEFVAFIDSDDEWDPWKLEAQLAVFDSRPEIGFCWTDMRAVDPQGQELHPRYLRQMYSTYASLDEEQIFDNRETIHIPVLDSFGLATDVRLLHGSIYRWMFIGNITHTPTVVIRKSSLPSDLRFEHIEGVGEDWPFHLKVCRHTMAALLDIPSISYQVGRTDQATRPENNECYARAYVQTIEKEYSSNSRLLDLPERMIRKTFAEGYFWLGSSLVDRRNREARGWIKKSLSSNPGIDSRLVWYLRSWLPAELLDLLRGFKKRLVR